MATCTIVVPCYNEAARLDVDAFRRFRPPNLSLRFLLVNDGSTDDTASVLEFLRDLDPGQFIVHNLPANRGKAEAVRQGILLAFQEGAEMVGYWDADLATPLEMIPEFCEMLSQDARLQIVTGARVKLLGRAIQRRPLRHYLGRVFATAASAVLGVPMYDTQCGAKLFRATPEIRAIFEQPFRTNWVFDVELLARFLRNRKAERAEPAAGAIYELPLTEWRDVAGSKVKPQDFFRAFFELATIYWTCVRRRAARGAEAVPPQRPDAAQRHAA